MGNQNGSAAAASKGGVGETLESMEREKERDAQLKRSKSFRRSITKRLGKQKNLGGSRLDEPDGLKPPVALEAAAAKKEKKSLAAGEPQPFPAHVQNSFAGDSNNHHHKMNRLRKSLRSSIRRKKGEQKAASDDQRTGDCGDVSSSSSNNKPHQWQSDENSVRSGTCTFNVKYLGSVEVFESRGMAVCEEAIKVLKQSKRRSVRSVLHVSGDGLRVVDDETKGLIVDQTIEKVSFCAPDRHYDHGFSYICRDGTTRRWMCHGFIGIKESGERLSHAVGCAFAICLEKKQKRDKECAVSMNFDASTASFTRLGSFRQASITERLQDPQVLKPAPEGPPVEGKVVNPFAIERPHPTDLMLQRQTSFRGLAQLQSNSPFKRQLSLRVSELPSNLQRMKTLSDETSPPPSFNCSLSPFSSHHTNLASEDKQPKSIFNMVSSPLPTVPENLPLSENNDAQFSSLSLELLQPEVVHGTDAISNKSISPTPRSKEVANPWDLVPDQPIMNSVNNKANNVSNCDSSSGISSTSSSCMTKPTVAVSSASITNASNNAETTANHSNSWLDQVTESLMTTESPACHHDANDTAVILEDPFDAEWAALAMRSSSVEQHHHANNNPFLNSRQQKTNSIVQKTFELQM